MRTYEITIKSKTFRLKTPAVIALTILCAILSVAGLPLIFYLLYSHYAQSGESGKATLWLLLLAAYGAFFIMNILSTPFDNYLKLVSKERRQHNTE